jgi:O-antigen/teichoic acid export membrane protein
MGRHTLSLSDRFAAVSSWRPGKLAKGTLAMTAGMGLRTIAQAGVFLIVAGVLGVEGYGAFAAVLAIAGTLGSFSGLGTQIILMRDVARDPSCFAEAWGRTLAAIAISTPILLCLYVLFAWAILPSGISWVTIFFIGLAELFFAPLALAGVKAYQGLERIGRAARLVLTPILPRLAGALALLPLALILTPPLRLPVWTALYALAALIAAGYTLRLLHHDLDLPLKADAKGLARHVREGIAFACGAAALKLYADIDKTMLARLATLEAAGAYSAGYRVVDLAQVPLVGLLTSALPKFFRVGEAGSGSIIRYGWRIVPIPLLYAVLVGAAMFACAPLLPLVLGTSYQSTITTLQWLAWLPLIGLPRLMLQHLLIGADQEKTVVSVLGAGAALNILLNMYLIPLWGWQGATIATYIAETLMACTMLIVVTGTNAILK